MSALEDRLRRFAYEWHEAMNSPYAVNMMPLLLEAASDIRSLAAPSLEAENAKLRKLVCGLVYATHPTDRARLIANAIELGMEVDAE